MNSELIRGLIRDIDEFTAGQWGIGDVQGRIHACLELLERDIVNYSDSLRASEGDLEEILFAKILAEQRPAATSRLNKLREELLSGLER